MIVYAKEKKTKTIIHGFIWSITRILFCFNLNQSYQVGHPQVPDGPSLQARFPQLKAAGQ
jgi:hypothetical protein